MATERIEERTEARRTRAWVLVQAEADHAQDVARAILALNEELKELYADQDNFVVRADVVVEITGARDWPYNIVAPVDVQNQRVLDQLVSMIANLIDGQAGKDKTVTTLVQVHHPDPPHSALGYITEDEFEQDPEGIEKPGHQGASPGENAGG